MENDIDLLYQIGSLRFVPRTWSNYLGIKDMANVAEHSFRLTWIALVISKMEKNVDLRKVLLMAISHDITETLTGDTNMITKHYVKCDEAGAAITTLSNTNLSYMMEIINEYEKQETLEAWVVKDADMIDCDLEIHEYKNKGVSCIHELTTEHRQKTRAKLKTESGKKLFDEIQRSHPYGWLKNKF